MLFRSTWSDSNCDAPRTHRDAEGRLGAAGSPHLNPVRYIQITALCSVADATQSRTLRRWQLAAASWAVMRRQE